MKTKQNKLGTYLAVTVGAGCAASVAEGAVTFYGVDSANDINPDPVGIAVGAFVGTGFALDTSVSAGSVLLYTRGTGYHSQGADLVAELGGTLGSYAYGGSFTDGAVAGSENYANISFDGADEVYEAVGQFFLDGIGGGYLIAIATVNAQPNPLDLSGVGGPALSISDGKALIDAASVPEPSSLALLALGATGLATRRNRKKAA